MEDFLGQMMQRDEAAGVKFVTECFLLLDPKDLKACRLVSKQWDDFIKHATFNLKILLNTRVRQSIRKYFWTPACDSRLENTLGHPRATFN